MSVNIAGKDGNLLQVAGNVPMDRVALMEQLAAQAAEHAAQAQQLAAQAKEIAQGAENVASNALPRYRTEGKPTTDGWYRIAKFTGASAISFSVAMADKYQAIAPTEINFSVAVRQMPADILKYDVDFLQDVYSGQTKIDSVRIVADNDFLALDFNYVLASANTDDICVEIFNCSNNAKDLFDVEMTFEKVTDEPELHYDYTFINGGGRIVNRAIADGNGNNIAEALGLNPKKYWNYFSKIGWYRIAKIFKGDVSFVLSIIKMFDNSEDDVQNFLIDTSISSNMVHIVQLSNSVRTRNIEKIRIVSENSENNADKYVDIYYNGNNENGISARFIPLNFIVDSFSEKVQIYDEKIYNPEITNENVTYMYEIRADLKGMVADYANRALAVDPQVFTRHQIITTYTVTTNDEIDTAINDAYNNAPNVGYFEFVLLVNVNGLVLTGGAWHFRGHKNDNNWGWVEGETYFTNHPKMKQYKTNGTWRGWISDSFSCHNVTSIVALYSNTELETFLNSAHVNATDHSYYEAEIQLKSGVTALSGGAWYISGYRYSETYGFQEVKKYAANGISYYARSLNNGVWNAWENMVPA